MAARSKAAKAAPAAAAPAADSAPPSVFDRLEARFHPDEVEWRVGSTNKKFWKEGQPRRGKPLCYVDARKVIARFNEVVGHANWRNRYVSMANGITICEIEIRVDGEWIGPKSNGAGQTDMEGEKGACSDAFKRAAVLWGVGFYLYDVSSGWEDLDERWNIPKATLEKLRLKLARGDEAPQSACASRKSGDYEKLEGYLRGAKTLKALSNLWTTHQATITKWPDEWIERITEEKDRCKATLQEIDNIKHRQIVDAEGDAAAQ